MKRFCPKCYGKKFVTVELQEGEAGTWLCPRDKAHIFIIDKDGYPRLKKD
ncbi:MAG: hypothetical protein PHH08_01245 [Candidatus ainarchaeum sp.]|nr:hypothetical protein [Candidatus ainarchaeum sp.]